MASVTVKEAFPSAPVVPVTVVMEECPEPCVRVTVCPETGLERASLRDTVTLAILAPSADTDPGTAVAVETVLLTGPAVTS